MKNYNVIKIGEFFCGIGGFRFGFENVKNSIFKVVYSNQWEPNSKKQVASEIYVKNFGNEGHSNEDITKVDIDSIPEFDMLVAGPPCQDYSVCNSKGKGIEGKKGVLWWEIYKIVKLRRPPYVLIENVDRLINSPTNMRGKDFAIILACLSGLGYIVEWRVINAADYGSAQKRKRIFIFATLNDSFIESAIIEPTKWLTTDGIFAKAFKIEKNPCIINPFTIKGDLVEISNNFNKEGGKTLFKNSGIIVGRKLYTIDTKPDYNGEIKNLECVLQPLIEVAKEFILTKDEYENFQKLKAGKKIKRITKNGDFYIYSEGAIPYPDPLDKPARTLITSAGSKSPNRCTIVVCQEGVYRRLTPIENERLMEFPDKFTLLEGVSDVKRGFVLGNALVVGVVARFASFLQAEILSHRNISYDFNKKLAS